MVNCTVENCDRKVSARGLCRLHYQRNLRGAVLDAPIQKKATGPQDGKCTHPNCDRTHAARGYCTTHLRRVRAGANVDAPVRSYISGELADRMEHYTDKTGDCWLWTGTPDGNGYGLVWDVGAGRNRLAHIVAWELENGEAAAGRVVRHRCDTPLCVRPLHLKIGTQANNNRDSVERGRRNRSPVFTRGQLRPDEVVEIRRLHDTGLNNSAIARQFGTTRVTVSRVVRRLVFRDI